MRPGDTVRVTAVDGPDARGREGHDAVAPYPGRVDARSELRGVYVRGRARLAAARHRRRCSTTSRSWSRTSRRRTRTCSASTTASRRPTARRPTAASLPDLITIYRGPLERSYGRDQAAAARPGQAHGAPRDRPPLRDQRRAPRRDRPLLSCAQLPASSSAPPAAATLDGELVCRRCGRQLRRRRTASRACSTRPRPGSTRSSASSPPGRSSRRSRAGTRPTTGSTPRCRS